MADNKIPTTECIDEWIKNDNPLLKKEHVLRHFKWLIKNKHFKAECLTQKYGISLIEANVACGEKFLYVLYNQLPQDVLKSTIAALAKRNREDMFTIALGASNIIINRVFEVLSPNSRYEILEFIKNLVKTGRFKMVDDMIKQYSVTKPEMEEKHFVQIAALHGQMFTLRNLVISFEVKREYIVENISRIFGWAAMSGHKLILEYLIKEFSLTKNEILDEYLNVLIWTAENGELNILQWIIEKFKITRANVTGNLIKMLTHVAENGHLEVLEWIIKHFKVTREEILLRDSVVLDAAVTHGHLGVLQWLTKHFNLTKKAVIGDDVDVISDAADYGQFPVVKWLVEHFEVTREDVADEIENIIAEAVNDGYSEMAKWLIDRFCSKKRKIEPTRITVDVIDLVSNAPGDIRLKIFHQVIKNNPLLTNDEIKTILEGIRTNNTFLCECQEINIATLETIAKAYDFENKSRKEATEILRKTCRYEMTTLERNFMYLTNRKLIPVEDSEPKLTIEKARELLPNCVIMEHEELTNLVSQSVLSAINELP